MKRVEMPANYRVLCDDKVVALFVHSDHVLSFIQNVNISIEHFTVQWIGETDQNGTPKVIRNMSLKTKLVLV